MKYTHCFDIAILKSKLKISVCSYPPSTAFPVYICFVQCSENDFHQTKGRQTQTINKELRKIVQSSCIILNIRKQLQTVFKDVYLDKALFFLTGYWLFSKDRMHIFTSML